MSNEQGRQQKREFQDLKYHTIIPTGHPLILPLDEYL